MLEKIFIKAQTETVNCFNEYDEKYPHSNFYYKLFIKGTPICAKCKKSVQYFGPIWCFGKGNDYFIHAICHGEVEIRRMVPREREYSHRYHQGWPNKEQWERMGVSFFHEFFEENISMWRGIPHIHLWRYNNDGPISRVCVICHVDHTKRYKNKWKIGYTGFYRQKIKIKNGNIKLEGN